MTVELPPRGIDYARRAISLANANAKHRQRPFGALVTRRETVLAATANQALEENDPTGHAELLAIRQAARLVWDHGLADCTLYASCEPCVMCAAAIAWAGLQSVVFCLRRELAATYGFPDVVDLSVSRRLLSISAPVHCQKLENEARTPFETWLRLGGNASADRSPPS